MIIPAGYIHAVVGILILSMQRELTYQYTPVNTIVFGGNFLHSYCIPTQLRLRQIEIDTKVPQRFRFPFLEKLCWYVADRYCSELRQLRAYRSKPLATPISAPHIVVLRGLLALADLLQAQVDILEDETAEEKRKKLAYERIPGDVIRDPAGLAKELRWRVERELPVEERPKPEVKEVKVEVKEVKPVVNSKRRTMEDRVTPRATRTSGFRARSVDLEIGIMGSSSSSYRPWNPAKSFPSAVGESTDNLPRPAQDGSAGEIQPVEIRTETFRQTLKRQYGLVGDKTVVEEREVVLTERRYIWGNEQKMEQVEEKKESGTVEETTSIEGAKMED